MQGSAGQIFFSVVTTSDIWYRDGALLLQVAEGPQQVGAGSLSPVV